jgi:hypothetical protein
MEMFDRVFYTKAQIEVWKALEHKLELAIVAIASAKVRLHMHRQNLEPMK